MLKGEISITCKSKFLNQMPAKLSKIDGFHMQSLE